MTRARPPTHDLDVMAEIQDDLDADMIASGYFADAPFECISLVFRYGLNNEDEPHYQRISKKYGDLPLSIEVDTHDLIEADRDGLKRLFMKAALKALVHAANRYNRPATVLERRMRQFE